MGGLADRIASWIEERVRAAGLEGVALGLSGGVDSAVVGALAAKALGGGALGIVMPCESAAEDVEHARLVAKAVGLEAITVDLDAAFHALQATLGAGGADVPRIARANLKPRLRMATLYYHANLRRALVAGTSNRSEVMLGYFTKHGDGAADILPLGALYKRDVRALARELGVPQVVIDKPPSAGLTPGQTDEGEIGLTYDEIDSCVAAIDAGDASGVDPDCLARVRKMIAASAHKRAPAPVFKRPR
ncbi:MAG: NAD(+) synthase [Planctomycetota bacterium]